MSHQEDQQPLITVNQQLDHQQAFEQGDIEAQNKLLLEMLQARKCAKLTQADVARQMGTKSSAIARLESLKPCNNHSPGLNTLRKYARAVGCKLEVKLVSLIENKAA